MVFDDGDEEDLDEAEVEEAIRLFEEKGNKSAAAKRKKQEREDTNLVWKKKGHEWVGSTVRVDFGDDGFSNCRAVQHDPAPAEVEQVDEEALRAKCRKKLVGLVLVLDGA